MSEERKRKNLGRGLDVLLGEDSLTKFGLVPNGDRSVARPIATVPVGALAPGECQPRRKFDGHELMGLANSIKEKGIIQPILVRKNSTDTEKWEIIAGERRWRAAQMAQIHEVPILIRELTDSEALEIALVENLQRENLTPLEEGEGYKRLIHDYSHTQEALSDLLGKSRSHVANMIRLLSLPNDVKALLESGKISAGHARALLNTNKPKELAKIVVKRGLNVRQTEILAKKFGVKSRRRSDKLEKDADTILLEKEISTSLGLKVSIQFIPPGGKLIVAYDTLEQLDDVIDRLKNNYVAQNLPAGQPAVFDTASVFANKLNGSGVEGNNNQSGELDAAIAELEAGARVSEDSVENGNVDELAPNLNLSDLELSQLVSNE